MRPAAFTASQYFLKRRFLLDTRLGAAGLEGAEGALRRAPESFAVPAEANDLANDLESALIANVSGGNYTAIVRGSNDATGIGLVEVYNVQ